MENTDYLSTAARAGSALWYAPEFVQENKSADKTSGCTCTRDPEAPGLSASRVHGYRPDNVFARLSCNPNTRGTSTGERAMAMEVLIDDLSQVIITGCKTEGA